MNSAKYAMYTILGLVLVACGQPDTPTFSGSSQQPSTPTPILQYAQVISGGLELHGPLPPQTPVPTLNPEPIIEGNTITILADNRWGDIYPPVEVKVGQTIRLVPFTTMKPNSYKVEYTPDVLMLAPGIDPTNPTAAWVWTVTKVGTTRITLQEIIVPCADCGGSARPSRGLFVDINTKP